MTTQTNDCSSCDFRIVKIPPQVHGPNATRPIWPAIQYFPRYVGSARGAPEYDAKNLPRGHFNWSVYEPVGSLPQPNTTFGYIEGVYGILNDHGLGFGESTCSAKLWTKPAYDGGQALLDIAELSRLALERTQSARSAIALMGSLAETYGYYGGYWSGEDDDNKAEAGETLTIIDESEAWVFHILPDDTGASAVWVAQRLPPTDVAAVANAFIIHEVDLSDATTFLGSANLHDVARRNGFWDGHSVFDFTRAYAHPPANPWYSTRRQWRVLTLANPALTLSPHTDANGSDYPFSVPAATRLSAADLMRFQRDHYEGTPWDLTQGVAAGAYGNPDRYETGHWDGNEFERAISIFRASYSYVASVAENGTSVLWVGPYAPHGTLFTPVYPLASRMPSALATGSLLEYNASSLFWTNAVVGNTAARFYKFAHPVVAAVQEAVEAEFLAGLTRLRATGNATALVERLTNEGDANVAAAQRAFEDLFATLMTRFHDGYVVSNFTDAVPVVTPMGYPDWWLTAAGYYDGSHQAQYLLVTAWVAIVLSAAIGFWFGQRSNRHVERRGYVHLK
ncbi:hypothetical protein SDRG_13650 [Saprolegnia diclina VS20]|uniref:Dipeptidase n=1 Tax=Saprolegnia diclina (strain VS20) TaxID=1156394 RepID=T0RFW8_SAPDV|nr:hypothetical protein SDRG_13650 [Saprolegnia diclina VS20]EQC28572.1 hypothetical protein SDRG_13650 [Saprolegnia diclina VS20]|eukprot:XP_008617969.1 hypothetical protein SDRG_13650 [Saprolegnia diclina VS20]